MLSRLLRLTAPLLLALTPACSVVNKDHCGNQDGNLTCFQRDPAAPYCSICSADNNGCLAGPPPTGCLADTAPVTSADPSATTDDPSATAPTSTVDPTTQTSTSTGTTATTELTTQGPTTLEPTTQGPTTAATTSTSTGPDTTGTTGDDTTTTGDATTDSTTGTTADTTSDTTMGGPVCGDNKAEGDEVCDGSDLQGETCKSVSGGKWGGGSLGCNKCMSFNDTKCCVGLGGTCGGLGPDAATPCCGGLTCKFKMLGVHTCQN